MTEAEWLACAVPERMLGWLYQSGTARLAQIRLLFSACCRRIRPNAVPEPPSDENDIEDYVSFGPVALVDDDARHALLSATIEALRSLGGGKAEAISLIRDIFGNPFRPVALNAAWLTRTVVSLAQPDPEERTSPSDEPDSRRLAILADALEEAGCDNADILSHLRSPGPHIRGCWAVDLILGKE